MAYDTQNRPTSPHLSIYRPQITSVLSIAHRLTGLALYAGSAMLLAWMWSAAYSAPCYRAIHAFLSAWCGQALLAGWTLAFFYHFGNGLRHLWWDTGKGFALPEVARSGWAVIVFTLVISAATWWIALQPVASVSQPQDDYAEEPVAN